MVFINKKIILFFIWFLTVLGLVVSNDPYLFKAKKTLPKQLIWNTIHWLYAADLQAAQKDLVMYRGDAQRNTIFHTQFFDELKLKWKSVGINVGIHGASKASVVSDDKNLYVGGDDSWFYCLNKQTGELIWKIYLADSAQGIHSTAALDENSVYVGSYRGSVYRIDKQTGQIIWMRIIGNTAGASPLIDKKSIVFNIETVESPRNGYLVKLDRQTGQIVWKSDFLNEQSHSSPALSQDQKTLVIGVNDASIQGFDFHTGERQWTTKIAGPSKSTAWIVEDKAYISDWGSELIKFDVKDGSILWKAPLDKKSQVSPAVSLLTRTVMVASVSGYMFGFDIDSGKLKWKQAKNKAGQISSPVIARLKNREYFLFHCEVERLCLIEPTNGKIYRSFPIQGHFTGSPYVDGNQVYLAMNDGQVLSYEMK